MAILASKVKKIMQPLWNFIIFEAFQLNFKFDFNQHNPPLTPVRDHFVLVGSYLLRHAVAIIPLSAIKNPTPSSSMLLIIASPSHSGHTPIVLSTHAPASSRYCHQDNLPSACSVAQGSAAFRGRLFNWLSLF